MMLKPIFETWWKWLKLTIVAQAVVFEIAVILGVISPTPLDTMTAPDAGWGIYANYGLFGPELTYIWAALNLIAVGIFLSIAFPFLHYIGGKIPIETRLQGVIDK